jgi:hypothetical protein
LGDANRYFRELYGDLTANVAQLVASRTGEDPGFMDVDMETGTNWRDDLLRGVGTCQVFVALLTASYVQASPWCAMEWDLFTRRRTTRTSDGLVHSASPVIPVLWAPIAAELPPEILAVQSFAPLDQPAEVQHLYRENGLFGLYRSERAAYESVVWSLAMEVSRLFHRYEVEPLILTETSELRRSFGVGEHS